MKLKNIDLFKSSILIQKIERKGGARFWRSVYVYMNREFMNVIPAFTKQIYDWSDQYGPEGAFRIMLSYYPLVIVCKPEDAEVIKTQLNVEFSK